MSNLFNIPTDTEDALNVLTLKKLREFTTEDFVLRPLDKDVISEFEQQFFSTSALIFTSTIAEQVLKFIEVYDSVVGRRDNDRSFLKMLINTGQPLHEFPRITASSRRLETQRGRKGDAWNQKKEALRSEFLADLDNLNKLELDKDVQMINRIIQSMIVEVKNAAKGGINSAISNRLQNDDDVIYVVNQIKEMELAMKMRIKLLEQLAKKKIQQMDIVQDNLEDLNASDLHNDFIGSLNIKTGFSSGFGRISNPAQDIRLQRGKNDD